MPLNYIVFVSGFFCLFASTVNAQNTSVTDSVGRLYRATLHVFSGRPDPEWNINETYPLYSALAYAIESCFTTGIPDILGYRGITVVTTDASGNSVWKTIGCRTNVQLEEMLLDSCDQLEPEVKLHVRNSIQQQTRHLNTVNPNTARQLLPLHIALTSSILQNPSALDTEDIAEAMLPPMRDKRQASCRSPPYDSDNWNYPYVRRKRNNCYNYATNIMTNTYAQPGRGSGRKYRRFTGQELLDASTRDGLIPIRGRVPWSFLRRAECLLALVIWPGIDYHFYRLDSNSMWSHKRGSTKATNVDESNFLIMDPLHADCGPYIQIASFLLKYGRLTIQ